MRCRSLARDPFAVDPCSCRVPHSLRTLQRVRFLNFSIRCCEEVQGFFFVLPYSFRRSLHRVQLIVIVELQPVPTAIRRGLSVVRRAEQQSNWLGESGAGSQLSTVDCKPPASPSRVQKAQKRHFLSPFPATLTHSASRNPFVCHSYANTRGVCITPPKFFWNPRALSPFRINACISVASKGLYLPLESTLMKKGGRGGV